MSELVAISKILAGIFAAYGAFRLSRKVRKISEEHPIIDYQTHSEDNTATWRWRRPESALNLKVEEQADASTLTLPYRIAGESLFAVFFGYIILIIIVFSILWLWWNQSEAWILFLFFGTLFFIVAMICLAQDGKYLARIELRKNKVLFWRRFGFYIWRKTAYQRKSKLQFQGKEGHFFVRTIKKDEQFPESDIIEPGKVVIFEYKIIVKIRYLFITSTKEIFLLQCNKTQGSWISQGLQQWFKASRKYSDGM